MAVWPYGLAKRVKPSKNSEKKLSKKKRCCFEYAAKREPDAMGHYRKPNSTRNQGGNVRSKVVYERRQNGGRYERYYLK